MKKIVLILAVIVLALSGCTADTPGAVSAAPPKNTPNPFPNSEIAETLIAKAQNNKDTNSFEGFTGQSSIEDVYTKIGADRLSGAQVTFSTELLGYPAVMTCSFHDYGDGRLVLGRAQFDMYAQGSETEQEAQEEFEAKLKQEMSGLNEEGSEGNYVWKNGGMMAAMRFDLGGTSFAEVTLTEMEEKPDVFPKAPDIFPYQLGTDLEMIMGSMKPGALPEGTGKSIINSLGYKDSGIAVIMQFRPDETGALKLSMATYNINLNDMEFKESMDYFKSAADRLEDVIGEPDSRGYVIPDVSRFVNGVPTEWGSSFEQELSEQDILNSGKEYYCFSVTWPGIFFSAYSVDRANMSLEYYDSYFGKAGIK